MNIYTISNKKMTFSSSAMGAEPVSLLTGKRQWLVQYKNDDGTGLSPLLFPMIGPMNDDKYEIDGKVYPMCMHGFARSSVFDVKSLTDTSVVFVLESDEYTRKMYPYDFKLSVTYTIDDTCLVSEYVVENTDNKPMYYGIGSHIGYCLCTEKENYTMIFDIDMEHSSSLVLYGAGKDFVFDDSKLDIKDSFFDGGCVVMGYHQSKSWQLINKIDGSVITYSSDDFPYLTLWSVPKEPFICIEPWSFRSGHFCNEDSLSKLPEIDCLESGDSRKYTYTLSFKQ